MGLLEKLSWGDKGEFMESFNLWKQMAGKFLMLFKYLSVSF